MPQHSPPSQELVPVQFTSHEAWLNFHNRESDESLIIDVVTSVSSQGGEPIPCPMPPEAISLSSEKTSAVMLPEAVAARIGTFCTEQYSPSRYSPFGSNFDCHSAVQYWLGQTPAVTLGIGTGTCVEVDLPLADDVSLAQMAAGYAIRSHYPRHLKHSYLGLQADSASPQPLTLSVKDINGPLLLASPSTIFQAYGGGVIRQLQQSKT